MSTNQPSEPADEEHLLIPWERADEILDTVRDRADEAPDAAFEAGLVAGAEHYDRLLREHTE